MLHFDKNIFLQRFIKFSIFYVCEVYFDFLNYHIYHIVYMYSTSQY